MLKIAFDPKHYDVTKRSKKLSGHETSHETIETLQKNTPFSNLTLVSEITRLKFYQSEMFEDSYVKESKLRWAIGIDRLS